MAAVNSAALGNGLAAAVNPVTLPRARQGNGGRQSCNCPLRPAAVNSAQGSISAAFFAQGKGMDWRRSILLPIAAGQLCFCRRSTAQGKGMAAVNSAAHCGRRRSLPWAKEWNGSSARARNGKAAVNPAAALSGRPIGNTALGSISAAFFAQGKGSAKEWIGSSARAARRPPICRNRRPAAGQLCCPGQGNGMAAVNFAAALAGRRPVNGQLCPGQWIGKGSRIDGGG